MNGEGKYLVRPGASPPNIIETSWRETYQNNPARTEVIVNNATPSNEGLFFLYVGLMAIFLATFIGRIVKRLLFLESFDASLINGSHFCLINCCKCKFYNNNVYLKCAVHPCTVLTSAAKDCPDYSPCHQKDISIAKTDN